MNEDSIEKRSSTLVVISAGHLVQLGSRFLIGAVVPLLLVYFETSRTTIGVALTGMWAVYALTQFPSGVLADRHGERSVVLVALTATCGGVLFVAFVPSIALFIVAVIVLGMGSGLFFAPGAALVSRLFANQGQALGVLMGSGALAGLIFPAVGGFVGVRYGWRNAFLLSAAAIFVVLVTTALVVPRMEATNRDRSIRSVIDFEEHWALITRPSIAFTLLLGGLVGFTFQAVSSFFPTFLVEFHGLGPDVAGVAFGMVYGLSTLAQPVAGRVSDRHSRDAALAVSISIAIAGIVTLLAVPYTMGLVLGVGLLGLGISWPGTLQARFFDRLSERRRGYGYGLLRTVYMLLASTSSVIVGVLVDLGGWLIGFGCLIVVLAMALGMISINTHFNLDL